MDDSPTPAWPSYSSALLRRAAAQATNADPEAMARFESEVADLQRSFVGEIEASDDFAVLVQNAGLEIAAAEIFAVLCTFEFDPLSEPLVRVLDDTAPPGRLTLAALSKVFPFPHPALRTLGPSGSLRRTRLVELHAEGPWRTGSVQLAPGIAWALLGDPQADPALPYGARVFDAVPAESSALVPTPRGRLTLVVGQDRVRRRELARTLLADRRVLVTVGPVDVAGWDAVVREATLAGAGVLVELDGPLNATGRLTITQTTHIDWALSTKDELPLETLPERQWREEMAANGAVTEAEWAKVFAIDAPRTHRLTPERLERVGLAVAGTGGDIDHAVRRVVSGRIGALAKRIRPHRFWSDLVLPSDQTEQLQELVARYRHRSLVHDDWGFGSHPSAGLVALFAGVSGTGKTLSAEVVAGELGLDLFVVSLASVVSKYIGETEQNLEEVFEAASQGDLVLFFDEADSLFAKRSEVNDSKDRYANLETSYLLQRLERHDGMVILATNLQNNIDQAFLRRIDLSVEFLAPEGAERLRLWRLSFPPGAPLDGVDLERLANVFDLTGGSIRKAALHAGFLAAQASIPITTEVVLGAVRREYQKLGRLLPPS